MIGKVLSHYTILKHIGSGGMGEVYLAHDTQLDRNVAIKILPSELATDPERMRRFEKEARAASAIDHPNVVHIYEIGEYDGIRFIAMQYVEGQTLSALIKDHALPIPQLLDIAIDVAEALQEANSKGVVHRDIKPANILITPRGQAKVVDFGLAKISRDSSLTEINTDSDTSTETKSGMILGTVHYLSPEQALGKGVDHRSDIFSFGAVLYQMATARFPFSGQNSIEMISNILKTEPEPLSTHNPTIPAALEHIVRKCLEKDPERRYQSAQDLSNDLRRLKRGDVPLTGSTIRLGTRRPRLPVFLIASVLLIIAATAFYFTRERRPIDSIAVLPFINGSSKAGMEYLSDGITDSVINTLSQLPQLRVMARSTVFSYKGKQIDPRQVGRELHVGAVLTGAMNQSGDELTIRAELVNTTDGSLLWGSQYNRAVNDVVGMQEEIAGDISHNLRIKLTGEQQKRLTKRYTENAEAYETYLKGRYYWNKRTEEGFRKAVEAFGQAIEKDPDYALSYAGLANCYTLMPAWALMPPTEGHPKAKAAALKALQLDDTLAEAHSALGHTLHNYDWDWAGAGREFRRAIELNPGYATAHHWNAWYLIEDGQTAEAFHEIQRALDLDPFSLIINADTGYLYSLGRQQDRAQEQLRKTLELGPQFSLAYEYRGYVYEVQKRYREELEAFEKAEELLPDSLEIKAEIARARALNGQVHEARTTLNELTAQSKDRYVVAFDIAMIYEALGEKDPAFEWLEKACDEHSYQISGLAVDPRLDGLRNDPRFAELLNRIHRPAGNIK
jgi:serine/threonine-protein kinase